MIRIGISPFKLRPPAGGIPTQAEATALFTLVGDIPQYAKDAWNERVYAMKQNGVWDSSIAGFPFLPTKSMTEVLRDAKNLTLNAGFFASAAEPSPFVTGQVTGGQEGLLFYASSTAVGTGYVKTGLIPSTLLTLNNTCIAFGSSRTETGLAGYSFGSFQSATQSLIYQKRNAANQHQADMYGTGAGGRITETSANGIKGCVILNRRSSTDFKLYKNGVEVATTSSNSGTLPTVEMYLNCYNSSGTASGRRNKPISYFWVYGGGMTPAQAAQESADWNTFATAMERNVTFTRNVVVDGNSHTVYWRSEFFRHLQYTTSGTGLNAQWSNIGVSGQATTSMITNGVANADSLFDAGISKNLLIAWEATNDISAGTAIATVKSNYQTYCANRRSAGYKVIAMSVLARDFAGDTTKILNSDLFNVWLRDNWATFADAYVEPVSSNYWLWRADYGSDAAYTTAIQTLTNNATYYDDAATHLTQLGYREWAEATAAQLITL